VIEICGYYKLYRIIFSKECVNLLGKIIGITTQLSEFPSLEENGRHYNGQVFVIKIKVSIFFKGL